jgi:hypothetical protein
MRRLSASNAVLMIICLMYLILYVEKVTRPDCVRCASNIKRIGVPAGFALEAR